MVERRPITNHEVRDVTALVEAGCPSKVIAPLINRSFDSANYVRRRYSLKPPKMTHMVGLFHISEHCWVDDEGQRAQVQRARHHHSAQHS
jgi:hypothetical protein